MPILDTRFVYLTCWVNTEPVTYYAKSSGTTGAGVTVNETKRMVIRKDHLPADSFLLKMDVQWAMSYQELGAIVPKVDDIFEDGNGVRWIIKMVEDHTTSYKFSCLRRGAVA